MSELESIEMLREEIIRVNENAIGTTGNWSIGQIFFHLAAAIEGSVEGLPPSYSRFTRTIIHQFRWIFTRIKFPPWIPIPPSIREQLEPPADAVVAEQYQRLLQAMDKFSAHVGDYPPHPVLGRFSKQEWIGFHIRHCQRHLAFIKT